MSGVNCLDDHTARLVRQALRDGKTLEYVAGYLYLEPELLGRLLELPTSKPVEPAADEFDFWSCDRLKGQL